MADTPRFSYNDLASMSRAEVGKYIADAMRAQLEQAEIAAGIHKVCDGVFFVTKPETMEALRHYYEQSGTFMGMKVMVPKKDANDADRS